MCLKKIVILIYISLCGVLIYIFREAYVYSILLVLLLIIPIGIYWKTDQKYRAIIIRYLCILGIGMAVLLLGNTYNYLVYKSDDGTLYVDSSKVEFENTQLYIPYKIKNISNLEVLIRSNSTFKITNFNYFDMFQEKKGNLFNRLLLNNDKYLDEGIMVVGTNPVLNTITITLNDDELASIGHDQIWTTIKKVEVVNSDGYIVLSVNDINGSKTELIINYYR